MDIAAPKHLCELTTVRDRVETGSCESRLPHLPDDAVCHHWFDETMRRFVAPRIPRALRFLVFFSGLLTLSHFAIAYVSLMNRKTGFIVADPPQFDDSVSFGHELLEPCHVADWNNKTSEVVPNFELHQNWAQRNLGNFVNLKDAELRPLSAFVYPNEIVVTTTAQNRYGQKVYCRYFDCNREELNGTAWETIMYPLSAAFCARRTGALYMSLTETVDGPLIGDPVPLTLRIADGYTHEISVCVGPIYGSERRWLEIAETTEHHLTMGVQHFYYTILNRMDGYTRKLVDEYERLGYFDVTVVQNEYSTMDWMFHLLQINDCHFRSRFHSKWVLNVDIDERLVMLKQPLPSFLRSQNPDVAEFVFLERRVLRSDFLPEKYVDKKQLLVEMQHLKYNKTIPFKYEAAKILFRPEKVHGLFYHWSFGQYEDVKVRTVLSSEAHIRHYRTAQPSLEAAWYVNRLFTVTQMDREFSANLTAAVTRRIESVYQQRPIRCEEVREGLLGHFSDSNYNCVYANGDWYRDVGYRSNQNESISMGLSLIIVFLFLAFQI